jgi:hypothetical protein
MTADEALETLGRLTASESYPTLDDDDLAQALLAGTLADPDGLVPSDADWTPTYDLNRAAAAGWRLKAGKVAGDFDVTDVGGTYRRSQIMELCERMATGYARRVVSSVPLSRLTA